MDTITTAKALGRVLEAAENASPVQAVEAVTRALVSSLGARTASFLVADLSGRALVRLTHTSVADSVATDESPDGDRHDARESAAVLPLDGGPAEQVLRTQTVQVLRPGASSLEGATDWTVLAPVTERGEALGLLEMSLPDEPDRLVLAEVARVAHVLAFVVIANRRHTDLFEWGQRSTPFSLEAEIQRRLLPASFTCEAGAFTLSAWLEPAASVGGDTFDYSLARDVLHLSVTDAMGHGVDSALTATLCVGSLRNTRRLGSSLLEQAAQANTALSAHAVAAVSEGFVTGLLGRVDLRSEKLSLVNAGHVAPYLDRGGEVTAIALPTDLPLGLFEDTVYRSTEVRLEPGDRLLLVTDGMLERNAANLDITTAIALTRRMHPREATRFLADAVLEATGAELADDATLVVLDWHGQHSRSRDTISGADSARAGDEHPAEPS